MPGQSTSQQQSTQSQTTAPWSAAQPLLNNIIGQLSGLSGDTAISPAQASAFGLLNNEAGGIPNFSPQATTAANDAFNTSTLPQQNLLTGANTNLQSELSPYLSSSYLNPYSTPGFSSALSTVNNDITNQVNDQFAAAGRDLSPANTTALARGLSQGEGALIQGQYNTNVGNQLAAANEAFGGANTTAGGLTQQQLAQIEAATGGMGIAGATPQLALAPGTAALSAANAQAQQPFTNLGWLSSLSLPIGAMGSQSTGTGTSTGTATQPWSQTFGQIGQGLTGVGNFLWSDENLKEDIEPIGMLYDRTPVYSYKYVKELDPDQTPRIGLLAQDVEQTTPEAVADLGGVKAVHYGKATERARVYGMLADLDMAA